jgi:hypothetical protein
MSGVFMKGHACWIAVAGHNTTQSSRRHTLPLENIDSCLSAQPLPQLLVAGHQQHVLPNCVFATASPYLLGLASHMEPPSYPWHPTYPAGSPVAPVQQRLQAWLLLLTGGGLRCWWYCGRRRCQAVSQHWR